MLNYSKIKKTPHIDGQLTPMPPKVTMKVRIYY